MTRTTLDLDQSVLAALRERGALEHKSMGQLASELLARELDERAEGNEPPAFRWNSAPLGMRVDLEDKDALWAVLDSGE